MSILKMKKFSLIIFEKDNKKVLDTLQNFKEVDFRKIELEDFEYKNYLSDDMEKIDNNLFKIEQTIKKLGKYSISKGFIKNLKDGDKTYTYKELKSIGKNSKWNEIVDEFDLLQNDIETNLKVIESNKTKILEYKALNNLDISNENIKGLKYTKVDIVNVPAKNFDDFLEDIKDLNIYYEIINKTNKELIISLIMEKSLYETYNEIARKNNFTKITISLEKLASEYISDFENENVRLESKNKENEEKLVQLAKNIEELELAYEYYSNEKIRNVASEKFLQTDNLNILSGYIPINREKEFTNLIQNTTDSYYHLELEEVDKDSTDVPIKLENEGFNLAFENLVKTYSMPKYNEVDPTPLVAPFYWLFFGMMVADFGYGLLVSLISYIVLKTCNLKDSMKKNISFLFYQGFSIMLWGIIYGSYFSLPVGIPGLINPATEYNTILLISILIGFLHIFVGLGVKAYMLIRDGKVLDAFYDVGLWYITLTTVALLIGGSSLNLSPLTTSIIKYLMIASMLGIILTAGREIKNIGGRIGLGTYALYGISGYMGDFISYARLMALGLSGGFIAQSVNQIGAMIGFKGINVLFVILIFIFGQTFNMLLSLLSAYVHSARLIYVEFFGKFYEGGGKEFKDFKIEEKYINIKEDIK